MTAAEREANHASPLSTVVAALERAVELGELGDAELAWARGQLSAHGRRNAPRPQAADRAGEIILAATSVFLRRSYHHATIEEIAGELQLTKAGVYHYFGSKQELLEAVCDRAMRTIEDAVRAGVAAGDDPRARLEALGVRYAAAYLGSDGVTVLMRHFDDTSPVFLATLRKRRKRLESQFRRVLGEGVARGAFDVADPVVVAFGIIGSLNWVHTWFDRSGRLSSTEVGALLVRQALNSVDSRRQSSSAYQGGQVS